MIQSEPMSIWENVRIAEMGRPAGKISRQISFIASFLSVDRPKNCQSQHFADLIKKDDEKTKWTDFSKLRLEALKKC